MMIEKSMKALEFDKILAMLGEHAVSAQAKQKLLALRPSFNLSEVKHKLQETSEAVAILEQVGTPPLPLMKDTSMLLEQAEKGAMLVPEQLTMVANFLTACGRMKAFLKRAESLRVSVADYGGSILLLPELLSEIERSIRHNALDDNASPELKSIRRKMDQLRQEVKSKLESILRNKKEWFSESFVATRNGHFVLPVKKECKNNISGSVLDISSSGSTYFIEPTSASKLRDQISQLEIEESNEERRILYTLTTLVVEHATELRLDIEAMEALDVVFAKAKLSLSMKAVTVEMNNNRTIRIEGGRHPLLPVKECVPLDFTLGKGVNGIVITGPNTGGKTVALKTVGLFSLMAQSGLHIPCSSAELCMNNAVLCDIGDGQSITENLSTFSSHIMSIIGILEHSDRNSLILLDELGSGTDPAEGMGIAIAILEELMEKGCLFVATTHYPEVKEYAHKKEGLVNARMAFDRESLKPLYRLEIGEAGESCALYIAKRLGLPAKMLKRAYEEAYLREGTVDRKLPEADFLISPEGEAPVTKAYPTLNPIEDTKPKKQLSERSKRFQIGDSVMVYPQKKIGIVYRQANEKGEVGVQIQKKKELINHKRLQLKSPATELYPEDYDFSIVFDSVANRKARRKMEKGYQADLEIVYEKEPLHNS